MQKFIKGRVHLWKKVRYSGQVCESEERVKVYMYFSDPAKPCGPATLPISVFFRLTLLDLQTFACMFQEARDLVGREEYRDPRRGYHGPRPLPGEQGLHCPRHR